MQKTYRKASRYTASSCTDLDNARFLIGSKKIRDARIYVVKTLSCMVGLYRTSLSGLEVRQIFKVRTHQKPDVLLPGRRTFITWKNGKKNPKKIQNKIQKKKYFFFSKFFSRFVFVYLFGLGTFDTKFVFLWEVITCNW